jgi:hypothetical protein
LGIAYGNDKKLSCWHSKFIFIGTRYSSHYDLQLLFETIFNMVHT